MRYIVVVFWLAVGFFLLDLQSIKTVASSVEHWRKAPSQMWFLVHSKDIPVENPKFNMGPSILPEVRDLVLYISNSRIPDYRLSELVEINTGVAAYSQRIVEGAWPVQPDKKSKRYVIYRRELQSKEFSKCGKLFEAKEVLLVDCSS